MINSMTGFGSKEAEIKPWGKVCVELRSSNHKFLETVFHLPEGFLSLEDRIKKEVEAKIERGRVTCVINIIGGKTQSVFINKRLFKNYLSVLKNIKDRFHIKDEISIDTLIHLPGVLSLTESRIPNVRIWPGLKILVNQALEELVRTRQKEGRALYFYLKTRTQTLKVNLDVIKRRFKKVIKDRVAKIKTDEECVSFLKETDITEEIERLAFHINNFKNKISKGGSMGKELDFIAQEMQREANTIGAKSFDVVISGRVIKIKGQIEKIREQVQNIE